MQNKEKREKKEKNDKSNLVEKSLSRNQGVVFFNSGYPFGEWEYEICFEKIWGLKKIEREIWGLEIIILDFIAIF